MARAPRIIQASHERLIITYSVLDNTVYLLTRPGRTRGLSCGQPGSCYQRMSGRNWLTALGTHLASQVGRLSPIDWVVARSSRGGTVYEPQTLGEDPAEILRAARPKLPDSTFQEMAEQLGEPTDDSEV